jgi:DNA polymerase III delta subunit
VTLFHRWRLGLEKNPVPKQITWVCGAEVVLVEEVVSQIRGALSVASWNSVSLDAREATPRALRRELDQHPLGEGARLIVVRHADAWDDWTLFQDWVAKRNLNPKTFVLFVSDEEAVPKIEPTPEERKKGAKAHPPEHIELILKRGNVIECRPFTNATAKYAPAWVQSMMPMRESVARHLMERSNFQIRLARDTAMKLRRAGVAEVTISHVNQLLAEQPRDTFVDALMARDIKGAYQAVGEIPESEYGRIIGLLDSRLDLTGMVHDMMVERRSPGEIAKAAGPQAFLVPEILPVAKHYNSKRRLEIRKALALVDTAWRQGHAQGLLEVVVAFW